MKKTTYWLDETLIARMKQARLQTGMSVTEFLRRALDAALRGIGL